MVDQGSARYFEKREAEEREAASLAQSEVARKIHLDLAEEYAARARELKGDPAQDIEAA
jgi:hypothetical protein